MDVCQIRTRGQSVKNKLPRKNADFKRDLGSPNIFKVRHCLPLRQLRVHRANRISPGLLEVPDNLIRAACKDGVLDQISELMPVVIVLLIKVAPKRNRSQSPADLSNRGGLVMTDTEKPREPLFEGHLSHPTIRPKASAISALDDMGSTQLEEVFDFMEAAPKLRSRKGGHAKISSAVGYLVLMIFAQIASDG
jgi:hypothetical protein